MPRKIPETRLNKISTKNWIRGCVFDKQMRCQLFQLEGITVIKLINFFIHILLNTFYALLCGLMNVKTSQCRHPNQPYDFLDVCSVN